MDVQDVYGAFPKVTAPCVVFCFFFGAITTSFGSNVEGFKNPQQWRMWKYESREKMEKSKELKVMEIEGRKLNRI